jgi:hypothetical protein
MRPCARNSVRSTGLTYRFEELRITPAPSGPRQSEERIIKGTAAGTPNPVRWDAGPTIGTIGTPPAIIWVRPLIRVRPSAVPLSSVAGCPLAADSP